MERKIQLTEQIKGQIPNGEAMRRMRYLEGILKKHSYWDTRPMMRDDKQQVEYGSIEGVKTVDDIPKESEQLPKGLHWCVIDIKDDYQLDEFYDLLTHNYIEDNENAFRCHYTKEFLRWSLTPPGYFPQWIVGIRNSTTNELIGSATGVPVLALVENAKIKMGSMSYLCVQRKYRDKNLAPALLSECTRRVNLRGYWQQIITNYHTFPTPFCRPTQHYRPLNIQKLIEVDCEGFASHPTSSIANQFYALPEQPTLNLRLMTEEDIHGVYELLNQGLSKFVVRFYYSEESIRHYFLPRANLMYTYVVEKIEQVDGKRKKRITDMISFNILISHVINNPKHKLLNSCQSFYNFATTVPLDVLMKNALIIAKKEGFDVFNCLDIMDNSTFIEKLNFQPGDRNLNYYFYNWIMRCRKIKPSQLGLVLF